MPKSDTEARRGEKSDSSPTSAEDAAWAEYRVLKKVYVVAALQAAKAQLYPNERFTEHQEALACKALWKDVYTDMPADLAGAQAFHADILRRFTLLEMYFQRRTLRGQKNWIPKPWADVTPGRGFFDAENVRGFRGTEAWLAADRQQQRLEALNRAVQKAVDEVNLRRRIGRGTYSVVTSRGRARKVVQQVVDNTEKQLVHLHRQQLQQVFGTAAVHKFLKRIAFKTK